MAGSLISHTGIAVADFEAAVARYKLLTGDHEPFITDVPEQKVKVAIFKAAGGDIHAGGRIELVAATTDDSPIARYIAKKGEGLHHICIYVEDIEERLRQLQESGVRLIDETPRVGAEGNRIAFVHPAGTGGVLLELEEKS